MLNCHDVWSCITSLLFRLGWRAINASAKFSQTRSLTKAIRAFFGELGGNWNPELATQNKLWVSGLMEFAKRSGMERFGGRIRMLIAESIARNEQANPELEDRDPTPDEHREAYVPAEYISMEGAFVLLEDNTHSKVTSFHKEDGAFAQTFDEATYALAVVNGQVFAFPVQELRKTLH